ncbi:Probable deoxyribodipyrimidine photolyase [Polaromonas sp. CG9_12]|nr:Probable deoxyribodipyrimidine photolyase [Polaromonas sp. CG9_12]
MTPFVFEPTLQAAHARIQAVRPQDYARTRNALDGAVTRLSPYLTHGFVSLPEVHAGVDAVYPLDDQHKFVFELGWRAYFQHVWRHVGSGIHQSLHDGLLPEAAYAQVMPDDIVQGRCGVPAIDCAVRELYTTGYLHNHARMWLASYVVHLRKVHWHVGAEWLYSHLLDGDLASNHLSWQWVAGTGSSKPYVFNADNVQRFAPASWHSPGSVIDISYEALDRIARSTKPAFWGRGSEGGVQPPELFSLPPRPDDFAPVDAQAVQGRDVWLVHPWALGALPADLPAGTLALGIAVAEFHQQHPWTAQRWDFVTRRMRQLAPLCWHAPAQTLGTALRGARSVHLLADPHLREPGTPWLPASVQQHAAPRLFTPVDELCGSFSKWRGRTRLVR